MIDEFLKWQLKIFLFLGLICLIILFFTNLFIFQTLFRFSISLALIFLGKKLYLSETSENWLRFSYSDTIKNILGIVFLLFGWIIFLRGILASAIGSLFVKYS